VSIPMPMAQEAAAPCTRSQKMDLTGPAPEETPAPQPPKWLLFGWNLDAPLPFKPYSLQQNGCIVGCRGTIVKGFTFCTGSAMQQFSGTSLKTRLYLLVLAAFIPVGGLIFYIAEEQKTIETEAILHRTMMLARAMADAEDRQLESARDLLAMVADTLRFVPGQAGRMSALLAGLLKRSDTYVDIGILDPGGRLVATGGASAKDGSYADKYFFQASLQGNEPAIGPYHGEHIGGRPVLYIGYPVRSRGGRVEVVVFAALDLDRLNRNMFKALAELPGGSRLTLLDERQGVVRYDAAAGLWSFPETFRPDLRQRMTGGRSGTLSAVDENKIERIYAFAPLASAFRNRQFTVVLDVPKMPALAGSNRIFRRNVAMLAASALLAVMSIWWAGNVFIIRRVRAMVDVSQRLASGDLGARIGPIGVRDELSHLAGVFDEMAASLQTRIEREKQVAVSLEQSREQLRKLAAYQQEVREQERIRIAREIHDQFGQCLTILKMDLSWLGKHWDAETFKVQEKMNTMADVIDDALKTLHAVMSELRPVILDDFGLAAALEWQIEEFGGRTGIACRMEKSGVEPDLPKDQATALFRIFQEILTNIMRHARADRVEVRLDERDGGLILEVRDNGRGIT
jgi:signal transduction histidine kinase